MTVPIFAWTLNLRLAKLYTTTNDSRAQRATPLLPHRRLSRLMKLTLSAICAIVMLFSGAGCTTEGVRGAAPTVVTVQFVNPGSFTDFSVQGRDVRYSASVFTQEVTRTLERSTPSSPDFLRFRGQRTAPLANIVSRFGRLSLCTWRWDNEANGRDKIRNPGPALAAGSIAAEE